MLLGPGRATNPYKLAIRRLRVTFIWVGLFSAAVNILMLTGPLFMLQVYDRVLSSGSLATLQGLFAIVVLAYLFLGLYDFFRTRLLSRGAYALDQSVGSAAFEIWVRSGMEGQQVQQRPLGDLAVVRGFVGSPAMLGFFDLPWVPFYLAIVFFIHQWLGYLAIAGALIVTIVALANQYFTHRHIAKAMMMDSQEGFLVDQSQRNAEALIPLGMMTKLTGHWKGMHADGLATGQVGSDRSEGFTAFSKAFRLLLQSSLLGLGGYLALNQEISAGMIVAASIIAGRALAPIDQVIGQWKAVVRARSAHKRLRTAMEPKGPDVSYVQLPDPEGHLVVRSLTKLIPDAKQRADRAPILHDVAFLLEPGDGLGVIGPSTSGKSTLARLLVGGWKPDAGEIRLDGATLEQWKPEELGKHIGYLPQTLELLAGTVKENICRFDPEADDEAIITAAKIAGVHEMILKLPDGYSSVIGHGATPLSGGQIQRVGLARALYGAPKLIVLDEPNSNLDASGDEALALAIGKMREMGSVVIVMAHRPSAISAVNKVLVLNEGKVVQFGDKAEVLHKTTRPAPVEIER